MGVAMVILLVDQEATIMVFLMCQCMIKNNSLALVETWRHRNLQGILVLCYSAITLA